MRRRWACSSSGSMVSHRRAVSAASSAAPRAICSPVSRSSTAPTWRSASTRCAPIQASSSGASSKRTPSRKGPRHAAAACSSRRSRSSAFSGRRAAALARSRTWVSNSSGGEPPGARPSAVRPSPSRSTRSRWLASPDASSPAPRWRRSCRSVCRRRSRARASGASGQRRAARCSRGWRVPESARYTSSAHSLRVRKLTVRVPTRTTGEPSSAKPSSPARTGGRAVGPGRAAPTVAVLARSGMPPPPYAKDPRSSRAARPGTGWAFTVGLAGARWVNLRQARSRRCSRRDMPPRHAPGGLPRGDPLAACRGSVVQAGHEPRGEPGGSRGRSRARHEASAPLRHRTRGGNAWVV